MTATTANRGYPYPQGSDFLGDTAAHMQALADAVDADVAALPQGELGYAAATANQGGITTETALTGLSVTVTVPAGRRLKVTASVIVASSVANDVATLNIEEGTTTLQSRDRTLHAVTEELSTVARLTPSAGTHTYIATLARAAGSGTVTSYGSATRPAFLLVEDMGAA